MKAREITAALAAAAAVGLLAGCGGGAPSTVAIHGTYSDATGACAGPPSAGDQVVITDPSGKVIATATLGKDRNPATVNGLTAVATYAWKATVPREARYGLTLGSMPEYWASAAQLRKGLDLAC